MEIIIGIIILTVSAILINEMYQKDKERRIKQKKEEEEAQKRKRSRMGSWRGGREFWD